MNCEKTITRSFRFWGNHPPPTAKPKANKKTLQKTWTRPAELCSCGQLVCIAFFLFFSFFHLEHRMYAYTSNSTLPHIYCCIYSSTRKYISIMPRFYLLLSFGLVCVGCGLVYFKLLGFFLRQYRSAAVEPASGSSKRAPYGLVPLWIPGSVP